MPSEKQLETRLKAQIADRCVDYAGYDHFLKTASPSPSAVRLVTRSLAINIPAGVWGQQYFASDAPPATAESGTSDTTGMGHLLANHLNRDEHADFQGVYLDNPETGGEIQALQGGKWFDVKSGDLMQVSGEAPASLTVPTDL